MSEATKGYKLYANLPKNFNASYYYRCVLPLTTIANLGLPIQPLLDDNDASIPSNNRAYAMTESDFIAAYQSLSEPFLKNMRIFHSMGAKYVEDQERWKWSPTHILDTDDDIFNVMPLNPAFSYLGTRVNGIPMKAADRVTVLSPDDEELLLWEDQHKTPKGDFFDVAMNHYRLDMWRQTMREADLITCSTPRVESYVKREIGDATPTYVYYNSIDFDAFPSIDLRPHPEEIRILWQGSTTHHEDLWPIRDALTRVMDKYPQAKLFIWGAPYKWLTDRIKPEQVEFISWVDYNCYKLRLATIGHDINLAPLRDNDFNRARSAIKWYEASALENPAATLAENTGAYGDEITNGVTGLLYKGEDEFERKLSELIEHPRLRLELAANAQQWVHENRDTNKTAPALYERYVEARNTYIAARPIPEDAFIKPEALVEEPVVADSTG